MADNRTMAGVGLLIAGILFAVLSRDAPEDGTGPGDPPPPGGPPPADEFIPVVTGNPNFQVNPF